MAVTGLRGTTSFSADGTLGRRPENWREMYLSLYPNGQAPLTALLALMPSKSTDDPIYHWFEKELPNLIGTITGIYTDNGLANAWGAAAKAAGATAYVKMSAADAANFKAGHVITVTAPASGVVASNRFQVLLTAAPVINGASSYLTGVLIEAFTSLASASYTTAAVTGTAHPEGDTSGVSIAYDPSEFSNYTQIFRDSLEATRTAKKTRLRTGDAVAQAKKECLEIHSIGMERAFFMNAAKYVTTGSNGQPLRITGGIRGAITTNRWDMRVDGSVANGLGTTWATTAADAAKTYNYLMVLLEQIFRYGSNEKIGFTGSGALLALQQVLQMMPSSQVQLSPTTMAYGFKVQELVTPFGTLLLKNHPLFTLDAAWRNDMFILDTNKLTYRYVDDTKYLPNRQANDLDGEKSEYLTECGLELGFEKTHAYIGAWGSVKGS